jgi:serine/threonine protein kinase
VYKGRRKCTGQITAMKFILKHGKSEKDIRNLRQEIEILRQLRHENIIQMLDAFETKTDFCVVTGTSSVITLPTSQHAMCTTASRQAGPARHSLASLTSI